MKTKIHNHHTKDLDTFIEKHIDKDRYEQIKQRAELRAQSIQKELDLKKTKKKFFKKQN